jgi:hypothetical protein
MTSSNRWTDGSTLTGPVADLFRVDLSTAVGRCTACGRTTPMAEVRVFDHAPGLVARCLACDQVLLRLVRARPRLAGPARPDLPAASHPEGNLSVTIAIGTPEMEATRHDLPASEPPAEEALDCDRRALGQPGRLGSEPGRGRRRRRSRHPRRGDTRLIVSAARSTR